MTTVTNGRIDAQHVKDLARGRWGEILEAVAGIPREVTDTKHHPCPICGGTDRFRAFDDFEDTGGVICGQCHDEQNGDGFATYQWATGKDFTAALFSVADYLGIKPSSNGNGQHVDPLARMAETKRCSVESLKMYGGTSFPEKSAVAFPMYGGDGKQCSQFNVFPDSRIEQERKGRNAKGKPTGIFLPHQNGDAQFPKAGEKWLFVEGVKDAARLHEAGYNVVGLPGKTFKSEWSAVVSGAHIALCLDNDDAGRKATPKVKDKLEAAGAASVSIVQLPAPGDPRDNIRSAGLDAVKAVIDDAFSSGDPDPWPAIEYDAHQLATMNFDLQYIVDDVVVKGQPGIAGGPSKTLKTSLMADLSLSIASGAPFLNRFDVACRQKVGFISAESGMKTLQETFVRIAHIKEVDLESIGEWLVITPEPVDLGTPSGVDSLLAWTERHKLEVVFADPAYQNFASLAEYSANVYAVGKTLRDFARQVIAAGVTPIIVHHTIKSPLNKYTPLELADLTGSGWGEFARQWILVNRRREYDDGSGFHELNLRIGGSAGHSSLWHLDVDEGEFIQGEARKWRTNLKTASQAKADRQRDVEEKYQREVESKRELILRHLRQRPDKAETKTGLTKDLIGVGRTKSSDEAIQGLVDDSLIVFEADCVHKSGRQAGREGYRLVDVGDQPEQKIEASRNEQDSLF